MKTVVCAATRTEARAWARRKRLGGDWVYAGSVPGVEGLTVERVVVLPGFACHRQREAIAESLLRSIAKTRDAQALRERFLADVQEVAAT